MLHQRTRFNYFLVFKTDLNKKCRNFQKMTGRRATGIAQTPLRTPKLSEFFKEWNETDTPSPNTFGTRIQQTA